MSTEDSNDLPYRAEYAKSSRASCRGCKGSIEKSSLRLAAMVQSPMFDGKVPMWYHLMCFFVKQHPKAVGDIAHFESLKFEDQEKIRKKIGDGNYASIAANTSTANGTKKSAVKRKAEVKKKLSGEYKIEYSVSSRATCRGCHEKIVKGEVRASKKDYDTPEARRYGGIDLWHHLSCFAKVRSELGFMIAGDCLPGFETLNKEDKASVLKQLPAIKGEPDQVDGVAVPKKMKEDVADTNALKKQSDKMFKMKDKLQGLSKNILTELLEHNNQHIPAGPDRMTELLQDVMTFGALKPCDKCPDGRFVLRSGQGYVCQGSVSEWVKCENVLATPPRVTFKLPPGMRDVAPQLSKYKCQVGDRLLQFNKPSSSQAVTAVTSDEPKVTLDRKLPFKDMDVFLFNVKDKAQLKIKVEKLGGKVAAKLHKDVAFAISNKKEVEKCDWQMEEIKGFGIQVVGTDIIEKCKHLDNANDMIIECSLAPWGSDPAKRIANTKQAKSELKSSNSLKSRFEKSGGSSKVKVKVHSGSAVEPESGLEDTAHVYRAQKQVFTATLGLTDIQTKKNSYYKLQLLESNNSKRYWVFRSWGRIGTTIGGNKLDTFKSLKAAIDMFSFYYLDKTGNAWENHQHFKKVPGKMYPISIDYSDVEETQLAALDASESTLKKAVQELITTIFNIDLIKKTMVEFEIDLEKMPLGKISKTQILRAYSVLTELDNFVKDADSKDVKPHERKVFLVDATNRFYTLVPHNFGIADPPLLDNPDIIKNKMDMLDSLLEIEVAYSIMKSSQEGGHHSVDAHYAKLNADIDVIERDSDEFKLINQYVANTHAKTHANYSLDILEAFKVSRKEEEKRFKPFKKLHNRKLLWHGSRLTNFAGILSQGLRIAPPEAPMTGYMFGKGIYFADMVSKSANYCMTSPTNSVGLIMLCEVALGNMYERSHADYIEKLPKGFHSCKGVGGTQPDPTGSVKLQTGLEVPAGKPVAVTDTTTSLLYNEYIVYDVAQVNIKYLCKINFNYKY